MINLSIDNQRVSVPEGTTILDAAKQVCIDIPTLCHLNLEAINLDNHVASCRVCVVEVEGRRNLAPSCATPVAEGMNVTTNSRRVLSARRKLLQLMLSDHPTDCLICAKSTDCELQNLAWEFGINSQAYPNAEQSQYAIDKSSGALKRDPSKCIMCRRCETMCNEVQTVGALTGFSRGFDAIVGPAEMQPIVDSNCVYCGQCVSVCPTAALTGVGYINETWSAIFNANKHVVVQVAPAVRVAIGDEFNFPVGQPVTGKLVSALRRMGFNAVFDTTFGADLTVMEEAHEIVQRVTSNENLPVLTSCCPGWINFLKYNFPSLSYMPSSCKSPQQMTGAISKSYYAEQVGVDPQDIVMVAVMPCIAKKYEAALPEHTHDEYADVDYVITTRELAKMMKEAGIDLQNMPDEQFDNPLGESTGAGIIFGATGGVLEAALRTVHEEVTGQELTDVNFTAVRGVAGTREVEVDLDGRTLRVAAVSGLGNARKILEKVEKGETHYDVIEIMACPGGCVNGGGQPYSKDRERTIEQRIKGLYMIDGWQAKRKAHKNPSVLKLYEEFLGEPGSEKAHELLHVKYYEEA